ncbi:MAG: ferrous iron transport protein A [Ideonella sp.]|nr:ferrous iron transport protein A [Ideonella sp.]
MRTILKNRAPDVSTPSREPTLADASLGIRHAVARLLCPPEADHWGRWLEEIGFLPGEQVVLLARAQPGGDPMVVRVGSSTFALRRAEAACVRLQESPSAAP